MGFKPDLDDQLVSFSALTLLVCAQISDGRGVAHQPLLVSENQIDYCDYCLCGITIYAVHCLVLTDGRMDGRQNYDPQDCASIAAHAVKMDQFWYAAESAGNSTR